MFIYFFKVLLSSSWLHDETLREKRDHRLLAGDKSEGFCFLSLGKIWNNQHRINFAIQVKWKTEVTEAGSPRWGVESTVWSSWEVLKGSIESYQVSTKRKANSFYFQFIKKLHSFDLVPIQDKFPPDCSPGSNTGRYVVLSEIILLLLAMLKARLLPRLLPFMTQ